MSGSSSHRSVGHLALGVNEGLAILSLLMGELGAVFLTESALELAGLRGMAQALRDLTDLCLELCRHASLSSEFLLEILLSCTFHAISYLIHSSNLINLLCTEILLQPILHLFWVINLGNECQIGLAPFKFVVFSGFGATLVEPALLFLRVEIDASITVCHLFLFGTLVCYCLR
jgi:hypothetical protein